MGSIQLGYWRWIHVSIGVKDTLLHGSDCVSWFNHGQKQRRMNACKHQHDVSSD